MLECAERVKGRARLTHGRAKMEPGPVKPDIGPITFRRTDERKPLPFTELWWDRKAETLSNATAP